jgi:multiple sugar transport system permease protein
MAAPIRIARPGLRATTSRKLIGAGFALPALALFGAFAIYPMIRVFYISFFDYDLTSSPRWVGMLNYRYLLHSEEFHAALQATGFYLFFT